MPPKRSQKQPPPTPAPGTTEDAPASKLPPKTAWKTGDQLEYMQTHWSSFLTHQNKGTLDRFWPSVLDTWTKRWLITNPSPELVKECGSTSAAILMLRSETNKRIRTWYHNQARPNSRAAKSELQLNKSEKRKLAPAQAYCAYAWDSGLREIVIARWEEQKKSHMSADEDDPPATSVIGAPGSGSHIPINFKLKIAKEVYNTLSSEEKQQIDDRREEDKLKQYRSILDIPDDKERETKLALHHKNQPSVSKSLLRVLKNLEDQAGCAAHLMVAYIDPQDGTTHCQSFCRGNAESGLKFRAFCGDDWEKTINRRFGEWSIDVFGDKESDRRSKFLLSDGSHGDQEASSSSVEETTRASVDEGEAVQPSIVTPPPQPFQETQVTSPQKLISSPVDDQLYTMASKSRSSVHGSSVPPQMPEFVTPQQMFAPPESVESDEDAVVVSQAALNSPPLAIPSPVLEFTQVVAPHQISTSPVAIEPPHLVAPSLALEFSQAVAPHQITARPMAIEPPHFVAPSLVFCTSQTAIPDQAIVSPIVTESPLVTSPVLDSSQTVALHQVAPSPIVNIPSVAIPSTTLDPSGAIRPQEIANQHQISDPSQFIHEPQTVALYRPSDPAKRISSDNPGAVVTVGSGLKLRDVSTATRSRRDSVEGAPDIMLTLGGSGYEVVTRSSQSDVSAPPSTTPSSTTPPPGELIMPSSQHSLEDFLTIPVDLPPGTAPKHFRFAPRVIPAYSIDRSDFPSWLIERGRLDYVLSVEAGDIWEKLITTWLRQERRLGFGMNEKIGASLSLRKKPAILKDYFKWYHNPSKGDSIVLPQFGDKVDDWWAGLQPKWRYKDELPAKSGNDYSYILAGGKKGVFLLILCLAWWDRAHGRALEKEKLRRREVAGKDGTALDLGDLSEHEHKWFNIVNDLIIVLELAQGWPVPGGNNPDTVGATPTRRKRVAEGGLTPLRKKQKSS